MADGERVPSGLPGDGTVFELRRVTKAAKSKAADDHDKITEDSAALEFVARHDGELLFDHDTNNWYRWTGTHWTRERTGLAFEWARQLARELSEKAPGKKQPLYSLRKVSFASGVEKFARHDQRMAVTSEAWDRDPCQLATPSGTVDLRRGELRASNPRDRITKLTAVGPTKIAGCPLWLRFLSETTGADPELIRFLQQFLGYALSGDTREHVFLFVWGDGGNGKTVFVNTTSRILGAYATTATMDAFVASNSDRHSTEIAMLKGARLVTASETAEGRRWNEARLKQITGADAVTARFMRQDNFTFIPQFKLLIIGNHKPVLHNVDAAIRRRLCVVPFTRKPEVPDRELETKLKAEWPGILRWMIDGFLDWQEHGLMRPETVLAATETYFDDQDLFAHWLADECDADAGNVWKNRNQPRTLFVMVPICRVCR